MAHGVSPLLGSAHPFSKLPPPAQPLVIKSTSVSSSTKVSSLTFFLSAVAAVVFGLATAKSSLDYEQEFEAWLACYHLQFNEPLEYVRKMETYIANDLFIHNHSAHTFPYLMFDEFAQMKKGFEMPDGYLEERLQKTKATASLRTNDDEVPKSVDWVAKGAVTAVKNQGQCGSCWAFSTTGVVFVSGGKLPNLSEQELVDCDHNGGLMDHAFQWTHEKRWHLRREVSDFVNVDVNDEAALKAAVAIEADQREFQFYKSGVFNKTCGTQLDHGVLAVGYGVEDSKKFWKVKNSEGRPGAKADTSGCYPQASWITTEKEEDAIEYQHHQQQEIELTEEFTEMLDLEVENMMESELGCEQAARGAKVYEYIPWV